MARMSAGKSAYGKPPKVGKAPAMPRMRGGGGGGGLNVKSLMSSGMKPGKSFGGNKRGM